MHRYQNKARIKSVFVEDKMFKKSTYTIMGLLVIVSMLMTACGTKAAEAPIIIGVTDQISSLDPADAYSTHDWELIRNTGRTLLRWNPGTSDLVPDLATGMPTISADGLTYTVTMKRDVKFGDGLKLTAPMFAEQLNRLLTIGPSCPNDVADALAIPYVESITAPDDTTIVFKLKSAIAYFPQLLATAPYTPAHPDTFPTTECVLFPTAPIYGVGPWFISQYTQNEQVVLEPNPYYTGDLKPQADQIIIRYFSDPQTLALGRPERRSGYCLALPGSAVDLPTARHRRLDRRHRQRWRHPLPDHQPHHGPRWMIRTWSRRLLLSSTATPSADTVYSGTVTPLYSQNPPGFLGANEAFDTMYTVAQPGSRQGLPGRLRLQRDQQVRPGSVVPARALRCRDRRLDGNHQAAA